VPPKPSCLALPAHKVNGIAEAIQACGTELIIKLIHFYQDSTL